MVSLNTAHELFDLPNGFLTYDASLKYFIPTKPIVYIGGEFYPRIQDIDRSKYIASMWETITRGVTFLTNPCTPFARVGIGVNGTATDTYFAAFNLRKALPGLKIALPPSVGFYPNRNYHMRNERDGSTFLTNIFTPPDFLTTEIQFDEHDGSVMDKRLYFTLIMQTATHIYEHPIKISMLN